MFKLVLIDDDAEVLAINQKYLTGAGFTVYTAISPREGVLSIRKNLPDCILLDVMLPEPTVTGCAVTSALFPLCRSCFSLPEVPRKM